MKKALGVLATVAVVGAAAVTAPAPAEARGRGIGPGLHSVWLQARLQPAPPLGHTATTIVSGDEKSPERRSGLFHCGKAIWSGPERRPMESIPGTR